MAAGDISIALEIRVRSLAGDNTASFTQARIMAWMQEAQIDIIRRLPSEALPEMTEQLTGGLTAQGTATLPSYYVKMNGVRYGANGIPAVYKTPNRLQFDQQSTYSAATCTEPAWTIMNEQLLFQPIAVVCYQLDYVKRNCADISTTVDPEIPVRYHDALVVYAAAKCEERQKAFDEASVHMSEYERCLALWGGTPR